MIQIVVGCELNGALFKMAFERMQNLMSSAGEALGLTEDPLHTLIGEKVVFFALVSLND